MKLRGGALFNTMLLGVIISIILTSIITIGYLNSIVYQKQAVEAKVDRLAYSGLEACMNYTKNQEFEKTYAMGKNQTDTLSLFYKNWGLYAVVGSQATSNYNTKKIKASYFRMVGIQPDSLRKSSLYLPDRSKPLMVCGTSKISGDIYISKAGLRPGYVGQISSDSIKIDQAIIKHSNKNMPYCNKDMIVKFIDIVKKSDFKNYNQIPINLFNSFENKTEVYKTDSAFIKNNILKGNICIIANRYIRISQFAQLENIIIIAPKIIIESGFKGNGQFISSEKFITEDNVQLNYPSTITLISKNKNNTDSTYIKIAKRNTISGIISLYSEKNIKNINTIHIEKFTEIHGEIYCEGTVNTSGKINGHVTCTDFISINSAGIFLGYLLNTELNINLRSKNYISSKIFQRDTNSKLNVISHLF